MINKVGCFPTPALQGQHTVVMFLKRHRRESVVLNEKMLFKGHTIEFGSFVGQLNISLVVLTKYFASRISPSFPGKQQFVIIPGLCHDLLEIWNTHQFNFTSCILYKTSLNVLNCALFLFFAVKIFLLELASIPYSYQGPADGMSYCLCRLQPHCTWSPCLIGECCTVKGKKDIHQALYTTEIIWFQH